VNTNVFQAFQQIALNHLFIVTLKTRHSDHLGFLRGERLGR
jgi:hypothetical protein